MTVRCVVVVVVDGIVHAVIARMSVVAVVVIHLALLTATIDVGHLCAFEEVDGGESRYRGGTVSGTVYLAQLFALALYGNVDGDVGLCGDTCRVVTAEDTLLDRSVGRGVGDVRYAHVAGPALRFALSATEDGVDLCGSVFGYIDMGLQGIAFGVCTAVHVVCLSADEVDGSLVGTAVGTGAIDVCRLDIAIKVYFGVLHVVGYAVLCGDGLHTVCAAEYLVYVA